jgi:hypothetical protein
MQKRSGLKGGKSAKFCKATRGQIKILRPETFAVLGGKRRTLVVPALPSAHGSRQATGEANLLKNVCKVLRTLVFFLVPASTGRCEVVGL